MMGSSRTNALSLTARYCQSRRVDAGLFSEKSQSRQSFDVEFFVVRAIRSPYREVVHEISKQPRQE